MRPIGSTAEVIVRGSRLPARFLLLPWGLAALLALAGCTRNTLVLVFQGRHPPADLACAMGADGEAGPEGSGSPGALMGGPPRAGAPAFPAQALSPPADRPPVSGGCAGVLFRLGPDGRPVDLRVVVESPPGFGFGDAAEKAIAATRFRPDGADAGWHYVTVTENYPASAPPPPSDDKGLHT